jgi:hypothetical protein
MALSALRGMQTQSATVRLTPFVLQKKKNTQSGTEFAKTKEQQAAIMREKQAKGGL